jgi:hypothetical protein
MAENLFASVKAADGESISDMLAAYGVRHEPGPNGKRYLFTERGCIGQADAQEAVNLLGLLVDAGAKITKDVLAEVSA